MFALLPALQASRLSLTDALRGQGGSARRGSRLRSALVVGQVAVALVLVITALTLARNGASIGRMDLGFDPAGVLSVNVRGEQDQLARPLADGLKAEPRVATLAVTSGNPLFNSARRVARRAGRGSGGEGDTLHVRVAGVLPDAADPDRARPRLPRRRGAIGGARRDRQRRHRERVLAGRGSDRQDDPDRSPRRLVGRRASRVPGGHRRRHVRDIVTGMMVMGRDAGHIYLPMTSSDPHATAILVRGRTDRELNAEALQEIFRRVVPDPQVFEVLPLDEMRDLQMYPLLAAAWVGALLGAVALVLSVSGLYGVLTYAISQRRKEIGIRMALGATAGAVVRLVLQQSTRLAGIGGVIGVAVTLAVMTFLNAAIHFAAITGRRACVWRRPGGRARGDGTGRLSAGAARDARRSRRDASRRRVTVPRQYRRQP